MAGCVEILGCLIRNPDIQSSILGGYALNCKQRRGEKQTRFKLGSFVTTIQGITAWPPLLSRSESKPKGPIEKKAAMKERSLGPKLGKQRKLSRKNNRLRSVGPIVLIELSMARK